MTALTWATASLQRALQPLLPGLQVQAVASVDSTSTRLVERLRGGEAAPRLLVAEMQTAGRGRNGRRWTSAPGASLTFSLGLPFAPADWSGLSLAVGAALADAIEPQPSRLMLKWPNDLWLADAPGPGAGPNRWRKLGGILIETVNVGPHRMAVVGVGLNVLPQPGDGLAHGYASLSELDPDTSAPTALARVARPLVQALRRFEAEGFPAFREAFARRDLLVGQALVTHGGPAPLEGTGEGVDSDGTLLLRSADGSLHRLGSGEVGIRLR